MDTQVLDESGANGINNDEQTAARRDKSKTAFVYNDLEAAVGLAHKLHSNAGTVCGVKQLASWMNQSATGGTFRSILGAARSFGLVETQTGGQVSLTELGRNALDDVKRSDSLAEAFLAVPLHLEMYSQFEGNVLPPPAAIQRHMVERLGVPPKQKDRARQTFTKSAQFAGFIDSASGRFIRPAASTSTPAPEQPQARNGGHGGDGEGLDLDLDPLLLALLCKIPPVGEKWSQGPRARWFRTFAMNVSQIYDTEDEVVDLVITVESNESELHQTRATE